MLAVSICRWSLLLGNLLSILCLQTVFNMNHYYIFSITSSESTELMIQYGYTPSQGLFRETSHVGALNSGQLNNTSKYWLSILLCLIPLSLTSVSCE